MRRELDDSEFFVGSAGDDVLLEQIIGVVVFCVAFLGLVHNILLSDISHPQVIVPSTHPVTFLGFAILSAGFVFRHGWTHLHVVRYGLCGALLLLCAARIVEVWFPEKVVVFNSGIMPETLAELGMYGKFSLETALFLTFALLHELCPTQLTSFRLALTLACIAVLSLGFVEQIYGLFLWGKELAMLTQLAMWVVSLGLLFRIRRKIPFHSTLAYDRSMFIFQMLALCFFSLPILTGLAVVLTFQFSKGMQPLVDTLVAGTSWLLFCLTLLFGSWIERRRFGAQAACEETVRQTVPNTKL